MVETGTEADLVDEDASQEIAKAVSKRHSIARKYVMRLRRRHPDATPAEVIGMLERHYGASIGTAGAVVAGAAIVADVGARIAGQHAAKTAGHQPPKVAARDAARGAAKTGARRAAAFLPAGDQQVQFEMTTLFALAIADIHGMVLDEDQARALVYGLSNGRVSQHQIAAMATELANASSEGGVGHRNAPVSTDWASTLAEALPKGAARSFVKTIQTRQLDAMRENLSGKQQAAVGYGVEVLAGGVTRFVFGRDVISAARTAFPDAPDAFPAQLALRVQARPDADEHEAGPNSALAALEGAAKGTGHRIADAASTVGDGISTRAAAVGTRVGSAAKTVTRPFRNVDNDAAGITEEPKAPTDKATSDRKLLQPGKRRDRKAGEPQAGTVD
jgi:hypothetical protein